jgi:hypothetical protein
MKGLVPLFEFVTSLRKESGDCENSLWTCSLANPGLRFPVLRSSFIVVEALQKRAQYIEPLQSYPNYHTQSVPQRLPPLRVSGSGDPSYNDKIVIYKKLYEGSCPTLTLSFF